MDKTVVVLIGAGVCCVVIGLALFVKLLTTKNDDSDEASGNKKLLDEEYAENFQECFDDTENIEDTLDQLATIYTGNQYMYNLLINALDFIRDEQGDYETALEGINVDSDPVIAKMHSTAIKKALNLDTKPAIVKRSAKNVKTEPDSKEDLENEASTEKAADTKANDSFNKDAAKDKVANPVKKKLQHFGSWVVRKASNTQIPDAPSGFRAYSREAAMRMNVVNDYTYTLETIVQAGREKIPMTSVPVRTNGELRPSRLFNSIWGYVKKSMITIIRAYMMYKPLKCFTFLCIPPILVGAMIGIRFLIFYFKGTGTGHVQSLILACTLIIIGFLTLMMGLLGDILASNKKLLEDTQYHVRRIEYDILQNKREIKEYGEGTGDAEGDAHE